jgi:hypothetical protein
MGAPAGTARTDRAGRPPRTAVVEGGLARRHRSMAGSLVYTTEPLEDDLEILVQD